MIFQFQLLLHQFVLYLHQLAKELFLLLLLNPILEEREKKVVKKLSHVMSDYPRRSLLLIPWMN
jgi:hypothetical protein